MGDISPNFNRSEFACRCGCGFNTVDAELLDVLEEIRNHYNQPVVITSGCRCHDHNSSAAVGGSDNSQHLYGRAADIKVRYVAPDEVYDYLTRLHRGKYGMGLYSGFVHVDTRSGNAARWKA